MACRGSVVWARPPSVGPPAIRGNRAGRVELVDRLLDRLLQSGTVGENAVNKTEAAGSGGSPFIMPEENFPLRPEMRLPALHIRDLPQGCATVQGRQPKPRSAGAV